jgi:hypothetical protein
MDNGYIIDTPLYNSKIGLYEVPLSNNKIINCYRIFNGTNIKYSPTPGYFYISIDNAYIFITEDANINDIIKNIIYSNSYPEKTNEDLLEINNDPYQKYSIIALIEIPESTCINLALQDNDVDRRFQIENKNKYNSYDCLVKNLVDNFKNVEKTKTLYETITNYVSYTPSTYNNDNKYKEPSNIDIDIDVTPVTNIQDIHQYNQFYVVGLTSLNFLLIILIIIIIIIISQDNTTSRKHIRYI